MSKLTDEQRIALLPKVIQKGKEPVTQVWLTQGDALSYSERIEAAATETLLQRIEELEANEKVLLAQIQGHTQWREKIIRASEQAYGESAVRYKFSLTKTGKCMNTFPKEIDGRWFALVPAEDDGHIGHIARIAELEKALKLVQQHHATARNRGHIAGMAANRMVAQDALNAVKKDAWNNTQLTEALMAAEARCEELEQRNSDLYEDVQRFKKHALNEKAARMELERQLEEARKDAEPCPTCESLARAVMLDQTGKA